QLVSLHPLKPLLPASGLVLAISPAYSPYPSSIPLVLRFRTKLPPRILGIGCKRLAFDASACSHPPNPKGIIDIQEELTILASHPIDPQSIRVRVEPEPQGLSIHALSSQIAIRGEWEPDRLYEIRVEKLRTTDGVELPPLRPFAVRSRGQPPQIHAPSGFYTVEQSAPYTLPFRGIHLDNAKAFLRPVGPGEEHLALLRPQAFVSAHGKHQVIAIRSEEARANRWGKGSIDLQPYGTPIAISLSATGSLEKGDVITSILQNTDCSISAIGTPNGVILWVTSIENGSPIHDVEIEVRSDEGNTIGRAKTNQAGIAWIPCDCKHRPGLVIIASKGGERTLLRFDPRRATSASLLGFESEEPPQELDDLRASLWTDRSIYRPGDRLRWAAFIRKVKGVEISSLAQGMQIQAQLWNSSTHVPFLSRDFVIGKDGAISSEFDLPNNSPLGEWTIRILAKGKELPLGSRSFEVKDFAEPKMRVDITLKEKKRMWKVGERVAIQVGARYLFGAPASRAQLHWSVIASGPAQAPERWKEYTFSPLQPPSLFEPLNEGNSQLSTEGEAALEVPLLKFSPRRMRYKLAVEVTDALGVSQSAEEELIVRPAPYEVGLRVLSPFVERSNPIVAEVIAIDEKEEPVDGIEVPVEIMRLDEGQEYGDGVLSAQELLVKRCLLRTKKEAVRCEHTPKDGGRYRIIAKGPDGLIAEQIVYVMGEGTVPPGDHPTKRIVLSMEKSEYVVGEKARITFENPWPKAQALLLWPDSNGSLYQTKAVGNGVQAIEFEVHPSMVPNGRALLLLVCPKGNTSTPPQFPELRLGGVEFRVRPPIPTLSLSIERGSEEGKPGETRSLKVLVRDERGKPVRNAFVSVWAVDEGVVRIGRDTPPQVMRSLFRRKSSEFYVQDLRSTLLSRFVTVIEPSPSGDGDEIEGGASPASMVQEAFEPTVLWSPLLKSDGNGEVVVPFVLPSRIGEYRIFAHALADEKGEGAATSSVVVSEDLLIQPHIPPFVTEGDTFFARFRVVNRMASPASIAAEILVDGKGEARSIWQGQLKIPGLGEQMVSAAFHAQSPDAIRVVMRAKGASHLVESAQGVFVKPRAISNRSAIVVGGKGKEAIEIALPKEAVGGVIRLWAGHHPFVKAISTFDKVREAFVPLFEESVAVILGASALDKLGMWGDGGDLARREREASLKDAIDTLLRHELPNGAFSLDEGRDREPDIQATLLALLALSELESSPELSKAFSIKSHLEAGMGFLKQAIDEPTWWWGELNEGHRALAWRLLARANALPSKAKEEAFSQRVSASPATLVHMAWLFPHRSFERKAIVELAIERFNKLAQEPYGEWGRNGSPPPYTNKVLLALITEAIAQTPSLNGRLTEFLRQLILAEGEATPYELAWIMRTYGGIGDALRLGGSGPEIGLRFDGRAITPTVNAMHITFELPFDWLKGGPHHLEAHGKKDMPLFVAMDGVWELPLSEADREARGRGVILHRIFETPEGLPLPSGSRIPLGSLVRVRLFSVLSEPITDSFTLRDPHGGGFAPSEFGAPPIDRDLEAIIRAGGLSDQDPRARLARLSQDRILRRAHNWESSVYHLNPSTELTECTYLLRAAHPGRFTVLPAEIRSQNNPKPIARSALAEFEVVADSK
ncbi:MAG: MG2 domain-containing protein, partial [Sandaracinaceae bacterium]|nr:MG2 domain-containing protein [Sandaracinaceae bacterium]